MGGLLSGLFGQVQVSDVGAAFLHAGGVVGMTPAPARQVPAAFFAGAVLPRLR